MLVFIVSLSLVLIIAYGVVEKRKNDKNIEKVPIRVNVNGIRGKSTITRLITSILSEAGYNTIGKTTGTSARILINQEKKEYEIKRGIRGVNITEQLNVIDFARKKHAEALVCECMAVNPEYQAIYQKQMIQANYGVIVNVLEDHMDLLGPSLDEVALAFTTSIPYNGHLIIQDNEYTEYFSKIANDRNTEVWVADEDEIPKGYMESFNHILFPNNVAIALALSKAMGIKKEVALSGMLKMNPDPGTLKIYPIETDVSYTFINGFAINDPQSALEVIAMMKEEIQEKETPFYLLFNARKDRVDRSAQFIEDVFKIIDFPYHLIVIGESTKDIDQYVSKTKNSLIESYHNYEYKNMEESILDMETYLSKALVLGLGNIHGRGYELLEGLKISEGENI